MRSVCQDRRKGEREKAKRPGTNAVRFVSYSFSFQNKIKSRLRSRLSALVCAGDKKCFPIFCDRPAGNGDPLFAQDFTKCLVAVWLRGVFLPDQFGQEGTNFIFACLPCRRCSGGKKAFQGIFSATLFEAIAHMVESVTASVNSPSMGF